jgi:hypothetical protein
MFAQIFLLLKSVNFISWLDSYVNCKGPFPYKSVLQPAVQASVQPVAYKFEVNWPCAAGFEAFKKRTRRNKTLQPCRAKMWR